MDSKNSAAAEYRESEENHARQYLTFMLANEEYGIDILGVQEIKGWDTVTAIPNMPDFVLGVINLRGTVVPIIDLRSLFGLETAEFDKTTVVIVVRVSSEDHEDRTMGIVVDAVSEVHNISPEELRPSPDFTGACDSDAIRGLATRDEQMIIILDVNHLMNMTVLATLDKPADHVPASS